MESRGPWMPGPGLFLLLLLPFPLLSAGSFKHSVLDRRNFRHFDINLKDIYNYFSREWRDLKKGKSKKLYDCNGAFDLYFVLDASSGVGDKWKDICKLVESMVKWYTNPKLRMSFITYSNYGNVLLRLTSDRGDIQAGLKRLKDVITSGPRNMHEGLKKANEEIARVFYSNKKAASLIFTVTAGPLLPTDLRKSKSEADRARNMKAKVYSLGIKDYQRDQLIQIVAGKTQMYEIPQIPDNEGFLISNPTNLDFLHMALFKVKFQTMLADIIWTKPKSTSLQCQALESKVSSCLVPTKPPSPAQCLVHGRCQNRAEKRSCSCQSLKDPTL